MSAVLEPTSRVEGMGAILFDKGVAFRVWAPHADAVAVIGDFNDWKNDLPMQSEGNGYWYAESSEASVGDEYKFVIANGEQRIERIDPYAREVTNSVGNAVVHDPEFDWDQDDFQIANHNELVIYELHVGTFNRSTPDVPGQFSDAIERLPHLRKLGVNAVEIMPVAEFAGDFSWGYNPAHIFAIEQAYGGPRAFKEFVKAAHAAGIAVIMDVVYNHFGPSDLDLWQFDGWSENGKGGIYFYNDDRSNTPWGDTRPDYGRDEVRRFIHDNAMMWLNEYRVDGLRYDMTAYIRKVDVVAPSDIPEGWSLMQWINGDVAAKFPGKLLVAEDLQSDSYLTRQINEGGAGFSAQWDANFVHPIRDVVQQIEDSDRNMETVRNAITFRYNHDAFERVIYSESHDEIANGKSRVPEEITPGHADSRFAQKRSVLAAGLVMTAPGIPMLMQGQELLEDGWFDDGDPLDWDRAKDFKGIADLYRDLISLRLNAQDTTRGLTGQHVNVHHVNNTDKLIAFHRWMDGGDGDDVVVVVNFADQARDNYEVGFPSTGDWILRFNSDRKSYSEDFAGHETHKVAAKASSRDGYPATAALSIGNYAVQIYSKDRGQASATAERTM